MASETSPMKYHGEVAWHPTGMLLDQEMENELVATRTADARR
jgi:hypothetical protein